jgi:hypothetical protein
MRVPQLLEMSDQHPSGAELQVILETPSTRDGAPLSEDVYQQTVFACNYAKLFQSKKIFRLSLEAADRASSLANDLLNRLPLPIKAAGFKSVRSSLVANETGGESGLKLLQDYFRVCAEHGLTFAPAFRLPPSKDEQEAYAARALSTARNLTSPLVLSSSFVCPENNPSWVEENFQRVAWLVERLNQKFGVHVECRFEVSIPRGQNAIFVSLIEALALLAGTPSLIQLSVKVDSKLASSQAVRKTTLIQDMCSFALMEFNRTQNFALLESNLAAIHTSQKETGHDS